MSDEQWKQIDGYDNYEVSNYGSVRNTKTGRIIKLNPNGVGYLSLSMSKDGKVSKALVHRLVATAFCENPEGYKEVDHIDNIKTNNHATNLRWASHSDNLRNYLRKNSTGFTGVTKQGAGTYTARATNKEGKQICLGSRKTPEEAHELFKLYNKENGVVIHHLNININNSTYNNVVHEVE